jgi:hypothetical protein
MSYQIVLLLCCTKRVLCVKCLMCSTCNLESWSTHLFLNSWWCLRSSLERTNSFSWISTSNEGKKFWISCVKALSFANCRNRGSRNTFRIVTRFNTATTTTLQQPTAQHQPAIWKEKFSIIKGSTFWMEKQEEEENEKQQQQQSHNSLTTNTFATEVFQPRLKESVSHRLFSGIRRYFQATPFDLTPNPNKHRQTTYTHD